MPKSFNDFRCMLDERSDPMVTKRELDALESKLDALFKELDIDIEFTKHFLDRVNDARNGKQITVNELITLYKKEFTKYGEALTKMPADREALFTDLSNDINIPFVMNWNSKKNQMELVAKTVMRKHNFLTRTKKLRVR